MTQTDTHQLQREIEIYKQALEAIAEHDYPSHLVDDIDRYFWCTDRAQQALIAGGKRK